MTPHTPAATLRICDLFDRIAALRAAGVGVLAATWQALQEFESDEMSEEQAA